MNARMLRFLVMPLAALSWLVPPLEAQYQPSVTVSWLPEEVRQGTIVQLVVMLAELPPMPDS
ncbi:MAG: hypothetical protein ACYTGG_13835, partial [Planctomycetota bacterium]